MKKVCVVTASRSEYGLLRWTIDGLLNSHKLQLQLVVTGAHLDEEQGLTYRDIEADGYPITYKVNMRIDSSSKESIVESLGHCSIGFSKAFSELQPDLVVVLGDRYELLPICSAALVMNIPIAHISGGDVTIGAIDNEIRNAVTMMSSLHFPGVSASAENIVRMRGSDINVWTVGEPGLENFTRMKLFSREELAEDLQIEKNNKWILVTVHPETQESLSYNLQMAQNIFSVLNNAEAISVIISKANADYGGEDINRYWESVCKINPKKYILFSSLGQRRYLSYMKECYSVIGNSSSGIVEAPYLGVPVINIGNRQTGRHLCTNVAQVDNSVEMIMQAWLKIEKSAKPLSDTYFGDGRTAEKIICQIENFLCG